MVTPLEDAFPGLRGMGYQVTSPATRNYNCIAWAVGVTTQWWWPEPAEMADNTWWPPNIPCEETLEAFRLMFATLG
jgi:hypothetical protein